MSRTDGLKANCLPNAAGRGVPDTVGLAHLLASRLSAAVSRVRNRNHKFIFTTRAQGICDIKTETVIASSMFAQVLAVDEDRRFEIHRSEMQQHPPANPVARDFKSAPVPEPLRLIDPFHDARKGRFDRKWNDNLVRKDGGLRIVGD